MQSFLNSFLPTPKIKTQHVAIEKDPTVLITTFSSMYNHFKDKPYFACIEIEHSFANYRVDQTNPNWSKKGYFIMLSLYKNVDSKELEKDLELFNHRPMIYYHD
jgi:hypothetical protein